MLYVQTLKYRMIYNKELGELERGKRHEEKGQSDSKLPVQKCEINRFRIETNIFYLSVVTAISRNFIL